MDTNELISHSRARFDHHQARVVLKEKYQAKLNFAHNGGMFRATPEMIAFLTLYHGQDIVLEDSYQNPIKVNATVLCDLMKLRWQEQMNAWFVEYEQVNGHR
jgi:hypothetical protein